MESSPVSFFQFLSNITSEILKLLERGLPIYQLMVREENIVAVP